MLALLGYAAGNGFNYLTNGFKNKPSDEIPVPESAIQSLPPIVNNATTDLVKKELLNAKWKKEAAEAVVQLNTEFFKIQQEENPNGLKSNLKQLCGLGKHPEFMSLIISHPELASLLARANDPSAIAKCFEKVSVDDYPILASIFVQFCDLDDATLVASALENSRDLICNLSRHGQLNSEVLFMFDHKKPGAQEYSKWLSEVIKTKISDSEEFASFYHLMLIQGPLIRKKMEQDEIFRNTFSIKLWPRLVRIAKEQKAMFEIYFQLNDQRLWDILALPSGEELVKRLGPLPINILYGDIELNHNPYPKELHDIIIQILLNKHNNEAVINALFKFRNETLFKNLLGKKLSPESLTVICNKLIESDTSYPNLLTKYDKLDNKALSDEVGPPPSGVITWVPFYYTLYEVPKKIMQGREPTGMDLFSAGADPLFLVIDILSGGGAAVGRKAVLTGGKAVAEKGAEKAFVVTLKTTGLEIAEKQLSKKVAEKLTDKELVQFTITGLLAQMKSSISSAVGKATTFEITKPLKLLFELSGVGQKTWKQMTGLDAKIFMRGDAKVFVRLGNVPKVMLGTKIIAFLNRASSDVALGTVVESDPGKNAIEGGVKTIVAAKEKIIKTEWQQHISAWWLVN